MKKKYCIFTFLALFILTTTTIVSAQDSQAILAEILRSSNSLSNNLSIEQRLRVFEDIQKNVQKIMDDYPGSNEAIQFLSGQNVGNFNLVSTQNQYLNELNSFYRTTCVIEPSTNCLAYVSLKIGSESCKAAENFDDISLAQTKIRNAIKIFAKNDNSDQIKNLALSEFRNCASVSKLTNRDLLNDYFYSQLVPVYLDIGEADQARAIIQQIDDPYLTFLSVIELTKFNDGVSNEFLRRMEQYVEERNIGDGDRVSSSLDLSMLALEAGISPSVEKFYNFSSSGCVSGSSDSLIFNKVIQYIEMLWDFDSSQEFLDNLSNLHIAGQYFEQSCGNKALKEALLGYSFFRTASKSLADQYIQNARISNFSIDEMQKYAFEMYLDQNLKDLDIRFPSLSNLKGVQGLSLKRRYATTFSYPFNQYILLKIEMLEGNLCSSVESLFKNYITNDSAKSDEVSDLLDFALTTNLLNSDETCGDSSLELLLQ